MDKKRTRPKTEKSPRPLLRETVKRPAEEKTNPVEYLMRLLREGVDRGFVYHED
ncbi:MAG: hypothetical protein R3F48_11490 [Candidatus Zixiibacteriota bacterium]